MGYTPHLSTSVWVGYPNARIEMSSVHGIAVAGGTFPAQIWHDYMTVAHGTDCDSFPPPTELPKFSAFYGGTDETDNGGTGGYDPNLYASPPQPPPQTQPQEPQPPPGRGNGNGNGRGNGNGNPPGQ